MPNNTKNGKKKSNKGLEIAAAGALLAAAAGYYFLYGSKQAKQNRAKIKSWALKAKAEVMEQLEKAGDVSEETFKGIVDTVSKKYAQIKSVDPKEMATLAKELKGHWRAIKQDIEKHSKAAVQGKKKAKK
jgi:hypothetical protein